MESFVVIVVAGTLVGLASAFNLHRVPRLLWDWYRMWLLVKYTNMDRIRFMQLLETGGQRALIQPMAEKLSEKGVLLAWKAQRSLVAVQKEDRPLSVENFAIVIDSLVAYRNAAALLVGRVGALAWVPGDELEYGTSFFSQAVFDTIRREWNEFGRQSAFLESFAQRYGHIETESIEA